MRYFIVIFCVSMLVSCSQAKRPVTNEITKIELARRFDPMSRNSRGTAVVSIDSTLTYNYYLRKDKDSSYYKGKISLPLWDTLTAKLVRLKFKNIPLINPNYHYEDMTEFELIVYWKDKHRRMLRIVDPSDPVYNTLLWIYNTNQQVKLVKIITPVAFQTKLQQRGPEPHKPKYPPIKSVPPQVKPDE